MEMPYIVFNQVLNDVVPFVDRLVRFFNIDQIHFHFPPIQVRNFKIERIIRMSCRLNVNAQRIRIRLIRLHLRFV